MEATDAPATRTIEIDVHDVTRVEGHGNIAVRVCDGELTRVALEIVESPRFFEAFLRGRPWHEAPHITCRVCGICSVGHTTASVKAVEAATGIEPTQQTLLLRRLILNAEHLQSHVLHLYFLAIPDFLGVGSVIPLAGSHPEVVKQALRLKRLANDVCAAIAGRHIHPVAYQVGGFTHVPSAADLRGLRDRLLPALGELEQFAELYATLPVPEVTVETEYVALRGRKAGEYALYDGSIVSTSDPDPTAPDDYRERIIEEAVPHSTAKHCHSRYSNSYAVGALARFNNNADGLHPRAARVAAQLGLRPICSNPYHNNTAQLIESIHVIEDSLLLIDELLERGPRHESLVRPERFGHGVGITEVPRGLLVHDYQLDRHGRIAAANLIIPTGQNLANIENDMRSLVPPLLAGGASPAEVTQRLEMLVRAYDPCISCSTHFLEIAWE